MKKIPAKVWLPVAIVVGGVVALLIRIRLGSPVLFCQERPGLEGKLFRPLAFTKTFAPAASVIVALTIIPPAAAR